MLRPFRRNPEELRALERIEAWTRARFSLAEEATVLVTQLECALPGCPPLETVIAFWTEERRRHHLKIFKPAAQVLEDDLPPYWMKDALAVPEDFECNCC